MISENQIKIALEKIVQSSTFKTSQTYQNLLKYLVEASLKNKSLKEYDIAIEIFGKDATYNPSEDPIVRVYVSNLRKKLKQYYNNEGKHDKIRFDIPSGHYEVKFLPAKSSPFQRFLTVKNVSYGLNILLLILVIILIIRTMSSPGSKLNTSVFVKSKVWKTFIKSDKPLMVVLGDDYFFLDSEFGFQGIHRFHHVNSDDDLEVFKNEHPELGITFRTPYTFTPRMSLLPLVKIQPLLCATGNIVLENSSRIKTADFLKYDMIFFGSFRNLYIFRQVLRDLLMEVNLGEGKNQFTLKVADSVKTFALEGYPNIRHSDYCLVRKVPGPKNNSLLLFVSFFESGMSSGSNYFTSLAHLKGLEEQFKTRYGYVPEYFDCLIKTSGMDRTALTVELVYLAPIDTKTLGIWK